MTFEEWADQYEFDLDMRETCRAAWGEATLAEREACAKACDEGAAALNAMGERDAANAAMSCAGAIRLRSNGIELRGEPRSGESSD